MVEDLDQTNADLGINKIGPTADKEADPVAGFFKLLIHLSKQIAERSGRHRRQIAPLGQILLHKVHGQMTDHPGGRLSFFFLGYRFLQLGCGLDHVVKQGAITHNRLEGDVFDQPHSVFFGDLLAQLKNNLFQVDIGRTDSSTGTTTDTGAGDFLGLVKSLIKSGEDNTDGRNVNAAEDMTTDGLINRADIGTGTTLNAAQGIAAYGRFVERLSATINQHDVLFFIIAGSRHGSTNPGHVGGQQLTGGIARQQPGDLDGIFNIADELVDTGKHHMNLRQGSTQAGISFVGDQADTTGFSYQEVGSGQPDISIKIVLAQLLAGSIDKGSDICFERFANLFTEQFGDFLLEHMNGGHHQMGGALTSQLNNPLTQIGFRSTNPGCL